ncbi:unnamed protein product [Effrenium voratum]|uniref:SAP domain-containing protein n=1 Tax=Effrenium voratum TaxID=2562239 RepID=A0AA36JI71_9DINO|nr:unnamed protein product [Effrenium voratum]
MTRGLQTEVEVPEGKDVGFAKNRAIDKLWQSIPFCHAVAALSNLRVFESGEELEDSAPCWDGQRLLLAAEPPSADGAATAGAGSAAAAYAEAVGAIGRHKLGLDAPKPAGTSPAAEELMKLPMKELKARLAAAGKSAEGCLEKADLVDRLMS